MSASDKIKDWRFVTVTGLPELVCIFIPSKTPNRLLMPALTTLAKAYGCRQKDINGMSVEGEWVGDDGGADFNLFSAAYHGAYKLKPFELWSWDGQLSALKLVRKALETPQMRDASWASKNINDSKVDAQLPRWTRLPNVGLETLLPDECMAYYDSELQKHVVAGTAGMFRAKAKDWSRPVVVLRNDAESFEIVGGKERVAQGILDGNQLVSVMVGDFSEDASGEYGRRVLNLASLEKCAGPRFTFWQHASAALRAAADNPFQVDWFAVDEDVLLASIRDCGQSPASVEQMLLDNSPSAVFPDRAQQISERAKDVAQYAQWESAAINSDGPRAAP